MQAYKCSNATGRQTNTDIKIMYLHESLLIRTYIITQHLKHILRRSYTHNHTSMLFDTAIIHYSSYRSSMNPQLNTWQTSKLQKCRGKAVAEYEPKYCVNKISYNFAARKYKHIYIYIYIYRRKSVCPKPFCMPKMFLILFQFHKFKNVP